MSIIYRPDQRVAPQAPVVVRPPPPPPPPVVVKQPVGFSPRDHFEPGGVGRGIGDSVKPNKTPETSLDKAKDRLKQLEANPPDPKDFPGFFGQFSYRLAVNEHNNDIKLAKTEVQYEKLKLTEPKPEQYPSTDQYNAAHDAYEQKISPLQKQLGPVLLKRYEDEVVSKSPTAGKILAEAKRLGVPVVVMSDAEYGAKYPGTAGVTVGGTVYVPASALEHDTGVLEHELTHAVLGHNEGIFDTSKPLDQRVQQARELFQRLGLDPSDGERLARVTAEWGPSADSDHVQTYVEGVSIAREKAGLPPLTAPERDQLYARAAEREAALGVQRAHYDGFDQKSPADQATAQAEAEAQWAKTPQGRANPPSGNTVAERAASLRAILDRKSSEEDLTHYRTDAT